MTITISTILLLAFIWIAVGKTVRNETKVTLHTTLRATNALTQTGLATAVYSANHYASAQIAELEKEAKEEKITMLTSAQLLEKAGL